MIGSGADWLPLLELQARERLPAAVYDWIAGGAGHEDTLAGNAAAWRALLLRPDALQDVANVDTATTLLGTAVNTPIAVAPSGFHSLSHPDAEIATASGTADLGALFTLSSRSSLRIEAIAPHCGPWWYQTYVLRDRALTATMLQRAAGAGARAVVLTVDAPTLGRRRRNRDSSLVSKALLEVNTGPVKDAALLEQAADVVVADIAWLAEVSGLPVVVKGVVRPDTAVRCVDAGAAAVWVSNHGGRQLDGTVSTAAALTEVVGAVAGSADVYVDGGICSGTDALRALALGARAVFVGRAPLWGLAVAGQQGVREVLTTLQIELVAAMKLVGRASVVDLDIDLIVPGV